MCFAPNVEVKCCRKRTIRVLCFVFSFLFVCVPRAPLLFLLLPWSPRAVEITTISEIRVPIFFVGVVLVFRDVALANAHTYLHPPFIPPPDLIPTSKLTLGTAPGTQLAAVRADQAPCSHAGQARGAATTNKQLRRICGELYALSLIHI